MATRWKRRWNRRHPPNHKEARAQGDALQPPKQSRISYPPGASQRPTPDCSADVGAPAFSSPPAGPSPTPQTEQNQHPPGASQRPTPDCSAAEPPHVGAPAFSSPPAGGQNLPTGAHSRRCTGLRAGARVSKRASAPGSSFRTHAGNTSTVDSVLGLPVFVVPYKSPFLQPTGTGTVGQRVLQPSRTTNRFV